MRDGQLLERSKLGFADEKRTVDVTSCVRDVKIWNSAIRKLTGVSKMMNLTGCNFYIGRSLSQFCQTGRSSTKPGYPTLNLSGTGPGVYVWLEAIVHIEISPDSVYHFFTEYILVIICRAPQAKVSTTRGWGHAKEMHQHLMFCWVHCFKSFAGHHIMWIADYICTMRKRWENLKLNSNWLLYLGFEAL